jgi:diaminopimelate epimerase
MRFAKGHGTGNDFVILPDPDGQLNLPAALVAAICDRNGGLGADGVLRVVRTAAAGLSPAEFELVGGAAADWFMDYRNADGSLAEMCGNGLRVFARYLVDEGLAAGPELTIGTRAGLRRATLQADGQITVEMGAAELQGFGLARMGGRPYKGQVISVGNPHLACVLDAPVETVDLTVPPVLDSAQFPAGANVEVLRMTGEHRLQMRVHERGSGVTMSCGTGAVAAAVAAAAAAGEWQNGAERRWEVEVPGGKLTVTPSATASLLTGPAVIVASGELATGWLASIAPAGLSVAGPRMY